MKTKFFKTLFVLLISLPFGEGWGGALWAQNLTVCRAASYSVASAVAATGASSYEWLENGEVIPDVTGVSYTNAEGKTEAGTYVYVRRAYLQSCGEWQNSNDFVVYVAGTAQPQGSCTYTEPAPVNTFADFPNNYGAATYVTLTDARDCKLYPVVQIGGRWWMARNLNYQEGLYFNSASNQANGSEFTSTTNGTPAIGSFWCPGTTNATSSTQASCDVWGALYTWETAMMVDGKWDADGSSTSNWSEPAGGGVADYIQNNGGRGAGGHGICPVNWHVPTDAELADILNAMELSGGTVHNSGNGVYRGSNSDSGAGARGKSVCRGTATDTDAYWANFASRYGNDAYGFRVLPAGYRNSDGSDFRYRGNMAYFWSSSAYGITRTWIRAFGYSEGSVVRSPLNRSNGFSVRCIRDE